MTLKEILLQVETSNHPVASALHHCEGHKFLWIAFKDGMLLKDHKTPIPAKLLVLNGSVIYRQGTLEQQVEQYEEIEIPANAIHSVEALGNALCLLVQG